MKTGIAALAFAVTGVLFAIGYNTYLFGWIGKPEPTLFANMPEPQEVEPLLERPRGKSTVSKSTLPLPPRDGPQPKAVVVEPTYEFGTMMAGDNGRHEFVLKNEGEFPLELAKGKTSCKCTISDLPVTKLEPGESTKVLVTWKTSVARSGKFRQTAHIMTNDRTQQSITLTVAGEITVLLRSVPSYVSFGKVTPGEEKTVQFKLHSYHLVIAQLEVESFEFEHPETAQHFDVAFEPLATDQLDKDSTSGLLGKITLKANAEDAEPLPIGALRQSLRVKTNVREVDSLPITIGGAVVKEFDISGRAWDRVREALDMGEHDKTKGNKQILNVWVRGPEWDQVEIEIDKVTPDWIQVVKKPSQKRPTTKTQQLVLEITIDKDAAATNLVGPEAEKLGHIVLKTTHSKTKKIDIPVRIGPADATPPPAAAKETPTANEPTAPAKRG